MERAGDNCKICEQPALSEGDTAICGHCSALFHAACLQTVEPAQTCPQCGEVFAIATETSAPAPAPPLIEFPECEFGRLKPSASYRFSLVVVSIAMVLLPVIYAGLVGLFVYGIALFAIRFHGMIGSAEFGAMIWYIAFLLYITPIFIGVVMTFFLVKPFFAPTREEEKPFSLNHADAPQLFALVGWICRSLQAPIPSRIDVDCRVNAGAGFRGGWRSLFRNDLRLVIGLPFVAGMNVSQLAAIIAHEYGHFAQGSAMRAGFVIDSVNLWLYRVVCERDKWDVALELASERDDQGLFSALVLYMARFGIWATRRVLWVLMSAGLALSGFMSRQMEFDADRYEIRMVGSEGFASVQRRLLQLQMGYRPSIEHIRNTWKRERKLLDQIPEYIVSRANEITAEAQEKSRALHSKKRGRLFETHPSDAERIRRAEAEREPGIFHCHLPATALFADFAGLSRRYTMNYYRGVFGHEISAERLISTQRLTAQAEHDYAADTARIVAYLHGVANELTLLFIIQNKPLQVQTLETISAEIAAARRAMEELSDEAKQALAELVEQDRQWLLTEQAARLIEAGFQFDPAESGLSEENFDQAQDTARAAFESAKNSMEPFLCAAKMCLGAAMQLLRLPQCAAQISDVQKLQERAQAMIFVLSRMEDVFEPVLELRRLSATLETLLAYRRIQPGAENVRPVLENVCMEIQERLNLVQDKTSQIRYPFHHAKEQLMVSEYARNKEYYAEPFESVLGEAQSHVDKLFKLHARALAELIAIAEEVEGRLLKSPTRNE